MAEALGRQWCGGRRHIPHRLGDQGKREGGGEGAGHLGRPIAQEEGTRGGEPRHFHIRKIKEVFGAEVFAVHRALKIFDERIESNA